MKVLVAAALADRQEVIALDLPEGATLGLAIERSGVLARFPALGGAQAGVWGRPAPATRVLRDGDRVELYRPVSADAKALRRARAALNPSRRSRSGP